MLDLFYPPKPWEVMQRAPDVFHTMESGKMTAEQKRRKDARAAAQAKHYLKTKTGTEVTA